MSSTFTGLQIGKSGLFTAMSALQVTGNNIANVNSEGYTRQKVDSISLGAYNSSMRYCTSPGNYKGLGTRITGNSQFRDASLDVRYRQEAAKLSQQTATAEGLNEIGGVFDDAINTVLDSQISSLITQLQTYASDPSSPVAENLVKSACDVMTQFFNQYSDKIETAYSDLTNSFTEAVSDVNTKLEQIASLNNQIKNAQLGEYDALELQDKRNVLLDELSQYMNIQVSTKSVDVGSGQSVETLTVDFVSEDGQTTYNLIDDKEFGQLELTNTDDVFGLKFTDPTGAVEDDISGDVYNGAFRGYLDVLNGKGTFAGTGENNYKGIPYYRQCLDNLASKFAETMNTANGAGKPMFEADDGGAITAESITLADSWRTATGHYITNTVRTGDNLDTDNTNILHMISELTSKKTFDNGDTTFEGSFQDYLTNVCTTLGTQIRTNDTLASTYAKSLDDIDYARESVSGVNLDEEAVNMITYNYALTAASRFLTTVDEALERLINSTGMVGR